MQLVPQYGGKVGPCTDVKARDTLQRMSAHVSAVLRTASAALFAAALVAVAATPPRWRAPSSWEMLESSLFTFCRVMVARLAQGPFFSVCHDDHAIFRCSVGHHGFCSLAGEA